MNKAGYAYLGTDGEMDYWHRDGFAYAYHEDLGFHPLATLCCQYARARRINGADHLSALDLITGLRETQVYAELQDVDLWPNQRVAWTLPELQEC